jgi:hypothetical protein
MTVRAPRIAPGKLNEPEVNRSLAELASGVDSALAALLLSGAALLVVPAAEAASGFAFVGTRRIYSGVTEISPGTNDLRVFSTGETIIRHPLGRKPRGRLVLGQAASSSLFDLDVAALVPDLDPAQFVAFRASVTTTFKIVVV